MTHMIPQGLAATESFLQLLKENFLRALEGWSQMACPYARRGGVSDSIGNYFDSMIAASENPTVLPKSVTHQAFPPALSGSPSATCGPSPFLGTAVSPKAAPAPRSTSKKMKKKIGRKKEGEMANTKTELPSNLNGKDPTAYSGPASSPRRVAHASALV
jgi:hypothetical protein